MIFKKWRSLETIEEAYITAGLRLGLLLSNPMAAEFVPHDDLVDKVIEFEQEYARRGYRPVRVQDFIKYHFHVTGLVSKLRKKRAEDEEPIFHARQYRDGEEKITTKDLHSIYDAEPDDPSTPLKKQIPPQ